MKTHHEYSFQIMFRGRDYICDVKGSNVNIVGYGYMEEEEYESLCKYIEVEGFITELDEKNGILDLVRIKKDL
jgi:hypothetical protein